MFTSLENRGRVGSGAGREEARPTVMNSTDLLATLSQEVTTETLLTPTYFIDQVNAYLADLRSHTVSKLWEMTEQMNILYPANWTQHAAEEIFGFQQQLSRKLAAELRSRTVSPATPGTSAALQPAELWGFGRGLLYSLSLLTTVGRITVLQTCPT